MRFLILTIFALLPATLASAVTLKTNGEILIGASDVMIDGLAYDLEFVEGKCSDVFDDCDSNADFIFGGNDGLAILALYALHNQVFTGIYDTDPSKVFGCRRTRCMATIPVTSDGTNRFIRGVVNDTTSTFSGVGLGTTVDYDTSVDGYVWAVFSRDSGVGAVPLPAGLPLLAASLAGFGILRRFGRRHRN